MCFIYPYFKDLTNLRNWPFLIKLDLNQLNFLEQMIETTSLTIFLHFKVTTIILNY